jgi:hypothetical protein
MIELALHDPGGGLHGLTATDAARQPHDLLVAFAPGARAENVTGGAEDKTGQLQLRTPRVLIHPP